MTGHDGGIHCGRRGARVSGTKWFVGRRYWVLALWALMPAAVIGGVLLVAVAVGLLMQAIGWAV